MLLVHWLICEWFFGPKNILLYETQSENIFFGVSVSVAAAAASVRNDCDWADASPVNEEGWMDRFYFETGPRKCWVWLLLCLSLSLSLSLWRINAHSLTHWRTLRRTSAHAWTHTHTFTQSYNSWNVLPILVLSLSQAHISTHALIWSPTHFSFSTYFTYHRI